MRNQGNQEQAPACAPSATPSNNAPATTTHQLTPAQLKLLKFVSHIEADSVFGYLHTTLSNSIAGFANSQDSTPTDVTLNGWYFTLDLLHRIHDIAVEKSEGKG